MFTKFEKDVSVHQSLPDEPNIDNGLAASDLKALWDKPAEDLKGAFNNLIDEMTVQAGANNLGASPLTEGDNSAANVQAKLLYLLEAVQNVSMGQIPDGSITKTKLEAGFANSIAVKDNELQVGLNAEKIKGFALDQLASYFVVTGGFNMSTTPQTIELGFTPRCVIINSGATRSGNAVLESTQMVTTEKPTYIYDGGNYATKPTSLAIVENGFKVQASDSMADGASYGTGYRYIAFR